MLNREPRDQIQRIASLTPKAKLADGRPNTSLVPLTQLLEAEGAVIFFHPATRPDARISRYTSCHVLTPPSAARLAPDASWTWTATSFPPHIPTSSACWPARDNCSQPPHIPAHQTASSRPRSTPHKWAVGTTFEWEFDSPITTNPAYEAKPAPKRKTKLKPR